MVRLIPTRAALLGVALAAGCSGGLFKSDEDGGGSDGEGDGTATTDSGTEGVPTPPDEDWAVDSTISGEITVELFGEDENGDRYTIPWSESGFESWPFGPIFVATYELGSEGQPGRYAGTEVIRNPEMGTTSYTVPVKMREDKDVYIYAAIDLLGDGVVGTEDPRGVWPEAIPMTDGIDVPDIDMTILTQTASEVVCEGGNTIEITGDAHVTVDYWGGPIAAMLMDSDGNGPYHVGTALEVGAGYGATTSYTMEVCADYGEMQLVAAWDANLNGIYDGGDRWGVYSTTGERDSNPINVGDRNMNNYPLWMPLGNRPGVDIVPFVRLQGSAVLMSGEPFSSLDTGSTLYLAALKYRPSGDLLVSDPAATYDLETFSWSELQSAGSSLDWSLSVPSDTIVYLWAFVDVDGDGIVNGPGEPIGAANPIEHGKTPTGQSGFGGIVIEINSSIGDPG